MKRKTPHDVLSFDEDSLQEHYSENMAYITHNATLHCTKV